MNIIFKKFTPVKIKQMIFGLLYRQNLILPKEKRIFVFLAADYGNIGDLAISSAQKEFLKENFTEYQVLSIPISKTRVWIDSIKKQINSEDIITIIGGGNMGSLYPDIEDLRQLVIKKFPSNKIICFPQTLDWDNSKLSDKALKKVLKVYSSHPNIYIFARESITYKKLKEIFASKLNVKIGFVPDIVMSTTATKLGVHSSLDANGILICLRDDKERVLNADHHKLLDEVIQTTGCVVTRTDTHAGGSGLDELKCNKLLAGKIKQFAEAKLVITDRLHGMILCMLSGTPCLVLPNSNHKIKQTYIDWLKGNPRLIFVESKNFSEIPRYVDLLLSQPRGTLSDFPVAQNQYKKLIEALSEK